MSNNFPTSCPSDSSRHHNKASNKAPLRCPVRMDKRTLRRSCIDARSRTFNTIRGPQSLVRLLIINDYRKNRKRKGQPQPWEMHTIEFAKVNQISFVYYRFSTSKVNYSVIINPVTQTHFIWIMNKPWYGHLQDCCWSNCSSKPNGTR